MPAVSFGQRFVSKAKASQSWSLMSFGTGVLEDDQWWLIGNSFAHHSDHAETWPPSAGCSSDILSRDALQRIC